MEDDFMYGFTRAILTRLVDQDDEEARLLIRYTDERIAEIVDEEELVEEFWKEFVLKPLVQLEKMIARRYTQISNAVLDQIVDKYEHLKWNVNTYADWMRIFVAHQNCSCELATFGMNHAMFRHVVFRVLRVHQGVLRLESL